MNLDNNSLSELMVFINRISIYNEEDLNKIIIYKLNKLILSFERTVNSTKQEFYKKRQWVVRDMTVERDTKD